MPGLNQLPVISCYFVLSVQTAANSYTYWTSTTKLLHAEETLNNSLSPANGFKIGISFFLEVVYLYRNMWEIRL